MFDQKAIAIPKDWGIRAFADAVEATLEELANEHWDSRIFQLGPGGLIIVARRPRMVEMSDPADMLDAPDWMDDDGEVEEPDDLDPSTREMLDKIFDLVGPVPLDTAIDGMSSAVHGVTRMYPARFLEDAWSELLRHHELHMSEHDDDGDACEYAQAVAAVLDAMREGLRHRLS
jgi:hypothetical protein